MPKNTVRQIIYNDTNWVCPAGVTRVAVRVMQYPYKTIASRSSGLTFINSQGKAYSFGINNNGQLGDGTITSRSSPVLMQGQATITAFSTGGIGTFSDFNSGYTYLSGNNSAGQLSDTTTVSKSSPVIAKVSGFIVTNAPAFDFKKNFEFGAAIFNTYGLSGSLYTWGSNSNGQLGDNTVANRSTAVAINPPAGAGWRSMDISCDAGSFMGGISNRGFLYLWGKNQYGQLGDGTTANKSSPTLTSVGTNIKWKAISCGDNFTAAISDSGDMYTWGRNNNGQLGDGTTTSRSTVAQLVLPVKFKDVATGPYFTLAIDTGNNLWAWGDNSEGQLGIGSLSSVSTPTLVSFFNKNIAQVACGRNGYFVDNTGALYSSGWNDNGSLGINTSALQVSTPTLVVGSSNWGTVAIQPEDERNVTIMDVIPGQTYQISLNADFYKTFGTTFISAPFFGMQNWNSVPTTSAYLILEYDA